MFMVSKLVLTNSSYLLFMSYSLSSDNKLSTLVFHRVPSGSWKIVSETETSILLQGSVYSLESHSEIDDPGIMYNVCKMTFINKGIDPNVRP